MPKVTRVFNKAQLDAMDATPLTVVSAPRDSGFIVRVNSINLYKTGTQIAGSASALNFRYVGDTTVLVTFAGVNSANGVLNAAGAAFDTSEPSAINAIAGTACIGKAVEALFTVAITANAADKLKVVVDYDLIQLT
jgi:hypothetical protein